MIKFYIILSGLIVGLANAVYSPYDAARQGDLATLRQYRFDGIDLFVPDERGFTPYELAALFADPDQPDRLREHVEVMLWLKEYQPEKHHYGKASIALVQSGLNALGYPVGTPDGIMGEKTAEAIRHYQKDNNLAETGQLGPQWLGAFYQDIIKDTQFKLTQLGYNTHGTDGLMGKNTQKAMLGYRFDEKLAAPQYPHLDALLLNRLTQAYNDQVARKKAAIAQKARNEEMKKVRYAQAGLRMLGYRIGKVDGVYGSKTANAIKKFQKKYKLSVDGKINDKTYARMHRYFLKTIQRKLAYMGYKTGKADGKMGKRTLRAISSYRKTNRLAGSGFDAELMLSVSNSFATAKSKKLAAKRAAAAKKTRKAAAKKANRKSSSRKITSKQTVKRPSKDVVIKKPTPTKNRHKSNRIAKVTTGNKTTVINGNRVKGRMRFSRKGGRVVGCNIAGRTIPIEWCEPFYPLPKNNHCEAMFKPSSGAVINLWCK